MGNDSTFYEKSGLLSLQDRFRRIVRLFETFTKIKPNSPDLLERIEKALEMLPATETIGKTIDELRGETRAFLEQARQERVRAFRSIEADFIRNARSQGTPVRELDNAWRVGMLEVKVKRDQFKVAFFYNHEPVVSWFPVGSAGDFENLVEKARALLEKAAIPQEILVEVFWDAYNQARSYHLKTNVSIIDDVPILDFYREVRIALLRHELQGQKPDKKVRYADLPRWAFLYNLDRYRALAPSIPPEKKLGFQSGSQREVAQGKGLVINGLDAREDYKVVCYVVPARPQSLPDARVP